MGNQNQLLSSSIHKHILQSVMKGKGTELLYTAEGELELLELHGAEGVLE